MTIQITLHANEFTKEGSIKGLTFNNGKYDSLKIVRFGNGRVYFMALSKEIGGKVSTFAKQMQLVEGNVIISFGKNDKLVIGTYVDTEAAQETPANEVSEPIEEIKEESPVNATEEASEQMEVMNNTNELKVSKQIETIIVRGYMGKVEEREGKRIEHNEFDLYLVKSGKHWTVYEKKTGKSISGLMSNKKEAMDKLQEFLTNQYDKFKVAIETTIQKEGYISDYKIGSWIKSA